MVRGILYGEVRFEFECFQTQGLDILEGGTCGAYCDDFSP